MYKKSDSAQGSQPLCTGTSAEGSGTNSDIDAALLAAGIAMATDHGDLLSMQPAGWSVSGSTPAGFADGSGDVADTLPFHIELAPQVRPDDQAARARLVGMRIDSYEVMRFVARGGMGEVYEARELTLGRKVAIKLLRGRRHEDSREQDYQRLLDEARAGALLDHSGFVHVYKFDVWEYAGETRPYLVMEWLPGETWRHVLQRKHRPLALEVWLPRLRILIDAIARAHERGILHRDLKPENILLTERGDTKIVDLGLACLSSSPPSTTVGAAGIPCAEPTATGTREYMAPEVWRAELAGPESDVWSLATIIYEVLAGQHPYWRMALSVDENARRIAYAPGPLELVPLPERLERRFGPMLRRALSRQASARYASATELQAAFDAAWPARPADLGMPGWPQVFAAVRRSLSHLAQTPVLPLVLTLLAVGMPGDQRTWLLPSVSIPSGMVYLPGGRFRMGLNSGEVAVLAQHCAVTGADCDVKHAARSLGERWVTLSAFLIDRTEVTAGDFVDWLNVVGGWLRIEEREDSILLMRGSVIIADIMKRYSAVAYRNGRFEVYPGLARRPIGKVTWDGALAYCKWHGGQLPTEAQWEYAAGGNERRRFPWGASDPLCSEVRMGRGSRGPCRTLPRESADVDSSPKDVTPDGVHDLGGNVSEWVMDSFKEPYPACPAPCVDPLVEDKDDRALPGFATRSLRGAAYDNFPSWAHCTIRSRWDQHDMAQADIGFRCVRQATK